MSIIHKFIPTACLIWGLSLSASVMAGHDHGDDGKRSGSRGTMLQGYVSHGINVFNNQPIADFSQATPGSPFASPSVLVPEVGAFNAAPGAGDADIITDATDLDTPVATISIPATFFGFAPLVDPALYNKTLDQIGSNFFGSTSPADRALIVDFNDAVPGSFYARKGVNSKPTVGQWNKIRGAMYYSCNSDGSGVVEIGVKHAHPKSLYTVWDVGSLKPHTAEEAMYVAPLGGTPNVILTDAKGCGHSKFKVPFCPGRPCEPGAGSCTAFVSLAYHWDDEVYGAAPAESAMGFPAGVIGSNHMTFLTSGTPLMSSHSNLRKKNLKCDD